MRLLWKGLVAVSLFAAMVGCRHTAGICDSDCGCGCETSSCGCEGGCGGGSSAVPATSGTIIDAPQALPPGTPAKSMPAH